MSENIERRDSESTDRPPTPTPSAAPVQSDPVQPTTEVRRAYTARFVPDALVAAAVGIALIIIGLLAIIRGGFSGSLSTPIVEVLGFDHTTALGLIELGAGLALLLSGVMASRSGALFFGSLISIAALVGALQTESFREPLGLEESFAWLVFMAGAVVVVAALLLPRVITQSSSSRVRPS
jgi:lysylphosphatidylglycerol synthetase-like protein (DUF2156 family)